MFDEINGKSAEDYAYGSQRTENAMASNKPTDRSKPDRRMPLDLAKDKTYDGLEKSLDRLQDSARSGWHSIDLS